MKVTKIDFGFCKMTYNGKYVEFLTNGGRNFHYEETDSLCITTTTEVTTVQTDNHMLYIEPEKCIISTTTEVNAVDTIVKGENVQYSEPYPV